MKACKDVRGLVCGYSHNAVTEFEPTTAYLQYWFNRQQVIKHIHSAVLESTQNRHQGKYRSTTRGIPNHTHRLGPRFELVNVNMNASNEYRHYYEQDLISGLHNA